MKKADQEKVEKSTNLITHYRPIGLKAVVAATSVKGRMPAGKQPVSEGAADSAIAFPVLHFTD